MATPPADRQLVRAINRATVLRLINEKGPISRAALARASGLSQVTVSAITSELIERGLVSVGDLAPSTGGRPATLMHLNPLSYQAIGIKVMDDHLVGAITDLQAEVLAEAEHPLGTQDPVGMLEAASSLVDHLVAASGPDSRHLLGVGIGLAGVVDGKEGICRYSPFFGWKDVPIADLGEEILGVPVLADNDVNTLALAERWFGVGRESNDFLLVTLGRGVGLGIVADGRLYRGARGGAGEFGHTVVDGSDRVCPCGKVGCLEATVSEPALFEAASSLLEKEGLPVPSALADLYRRVAEHEGLVELFERSGRMLGRGVANLVNLFAPELVILSGEGIRAGTPLLEPMREELERRVFPGLTGSYQLVIEPLPDAAWARGAASLVLGEIFDTPTRARLDLFWEREAAS